MKQPLVFAVLVMFTVSLSSCFVGGQMSKKDLRFHEKKEKTHRLRHTGCHATQGFGGY